MRREMRYGVASLRRRPLFALAAWSVPEALPTAISGVAIARAVDTGFLAARPLVGLAWLGGLVLASGVGAVGSRQVYRRLGDLVEPFRDDLVRRVVAGALRHSVAGHADDGAVARLTRQVEIVRDTYAGLIVLVNGFLITVVGVVTGLLSIAPIIALLMMPPFLLGFAAFLATLGMAAARQRAAVRAEERLASSAGAVLAGTRDVVARGAEEHAARMVAGPIEDQADAERALARVAALRTLSFAMGGWLPLLVLLFSGPWLASRGLTAGAIMGGLTYVLFGLQPALRTLHGGLGSAGLRFVVTLGRILDASTPPPVPPRRARSVGARCDLALRGVRFAYGPHAEPVLRDLDLTVPEGDHLAVVGPSGIGKSTLAGLLCGLLRPDAGAVRIGGVPAVELPTDRLAKVRVLIPQEAYVFASTVWDNLTYLRSTATAAEVDRAVAAVGAEALVARLGGCSAGLQPAELSAGERQLIALVRAYLSAAPVVVLDEATCHLDPVAERRAEEAFATRGGTLIVIAHRISSALRASRILVLDGTSATIGDHLTLLSTSPLYRELLGHWQVAGARPADGAPPAPAAPVLPTAPPVLPPAPVGVPPAPVGVPVAATGNGRASGNGQPAGHPPVGSHRAADPAGRHRTRPPRERTAPLPPPAATTGAGPVSGAGAQADAVIFGLVTGDSGAPVTGATVTLADLSGRALSRHTSNRSGHYRLGPPAPGSYLVICASPAHEPQAALVAVADVPVRHDVVLASSASSLSGTVRTAGPAPRGIADAVVRLTDLRGEVAATTTGADGRFRFGELAEGDYMLTVAAWTLPPVTHSVTVPAAANVTCDVEIAARSRLVGNESRLVGNERSARARARFPEALATLIDQHGREGRWGA